jgi:hypothetical protein
MGDRRFESTSLQRRVIDEPWSPRLIYGLTSCGAINFTEPRDGIIQPMTGRFYLTGDDLTTPATPNTSQAPQRGFLAASPIPVWGGGRWLAGRLMVAGLSPINSRELPIIVRAVFTFVAVETPSNLAAVIAVSVDPVRSERIEH